MKTLKYKSQLKIVYNGPDKLSVMRKTNKKCIFMQAHGERTFRTMYIHMYTYLFIYLDIVHTLLQQRRTNTRKSAKK